MNLSQQKPTASPLSVVPSNKIEFHMEIPEPTKQESVTMDSEIEEDVTEKSSEPHPDASDGHIFSEEDENPSKNTPIHTPSGTADPEAEVVALTPEILMAVNRFLCEVCGKGFKRDQNLQLHRRGHNLPWKLPLRTSKDVRKKVYICPEVTCVHHDPSRALGDLTGIKKHFSRKHGDKTFKCEKCSKCYAVQSDWKAHQKTCGTREYRCDCGTLFSRRDSFITHRAFCDALGDHVHGESGNRLEGAPRLTGTGGAHQISFNAPGAPPGWTGNREGSSASLLESNQQLRLQLGQLAEARSASKHLAARGSEGELELFQKAINQHQQGGGGSSNQLLSSLAFSQSGNVNMANLLSGNQQRNLLSSLFSTAGRGGAGFHLFATGSGGGSGAYSDVLSQSGSGFGLSLEPQGSLRLDPSGSQGISLQQGHLHQARGSLPPESGSHGHGQAGSSTSPSLQSLAASILTSPNSNLGSLLPGVSQYGTPSAVPQNSDQLLMGLQSVSNTAQPMGGSGSALSLAALSSFLSSQDPNALALLGLLSSNSSPNGNPSGQNVQQRFGSAPSSDSGRHRSVGMNQFSNFGRSATGASGGGASAALGNDSERVAINQGQFPGAYQAFSMRGSGGDDGSQPSREGGGGGGGAPQREELRSLDSVTRDFLGISGNFTPNDLSALASGLLNHKSNNDPDQGQGRGGSK